MFAIAFTFVCAIQTARHPPTQHPAVRQPRGPASEFRGHPGDKSPVNCTDVKPSSKSPVCKPNLDGGAVLTGLSTKGHEALF